MSTISRQTFHMLFGNPTAFLLEHPFTPPSDLAVLLTLSAWYRPRTVIEFGVNRGATAANLLANSPWIETYIGVDVPPDFRTPLGLQQNEVPKRAGELVTDESRFSLLLPKRGTADLEPDALPSADLIFIDDDHSEAGVKRATALARAVLRDGRGVLCWHDYGNNSLGVSKAINEMNNAENQRICWVEGTWTCFELRGVALSAAHAAGMERPEPQPAGVRGESFPPSAGGGVA